MIKFETNKGKGNIEIKGDIAEIIADIMMVVGTIYAELDTETRRVFKNVVKKSINDDMPFKGVDNPFMFGIKAQADDFLDFLDDFIKTCKKRRGADDGERNRD